MKVFGTANLWPQPGAWLRDRELYPPITVSVDGPEVIMNVADRERVLLLSSTARQLARILLAAADHADPDPDDEIYDLVKD